MEDLGGNYTSSKEESRIRNSVTVPYATFSAKRNNDDDGCAFVYQVTFHINEWNI